jgi:UDP-glucose 4-epimerase
MILITGGAGFIGSHVNRLFQQMNLKTVIFDNLSKGSIKAIPNTPFIEGDLRDKGDISRAFKAYPSIQAVVHLAALTDVGESVREPDRYFEHNTLGSIHLFEAMEAHGVKRIIFSSTAAVYGDPLATPTDETHPLHPINPYGESKLEVEKRMEALHRKGKLHFTAFRYFNAAGGDPEGKVKNYKVAENNLIPLMFNAIKEDRPLIVFGDNWETPDGTCVRDYIHVADIATAHALALKDRAAETYNLGNGKGFSVKEVIFAAEKVLKRKIKWELGPKRAGDPPLLVADSQKARKLLSWNPRYPEIEKIILDAWNALP